ncbi:hypothetical protein JY651_05745 [Pyxidicoccus parkwayensis]|uniref:Uncharacterized protein n=1 Tax=Pyxidicoccus parkwayensis TaxID=2813578 RepID=A0ABX7P278_9BACT|nr:hypothetical protein [Pyxidicoccus parkwaysis]QSQ24454.1 hypothetical protein JY651_05745 [Pyxidicoccus parkwaysis]
MKKTLMMGLLGMLLGVATAVGSATLGSEETAARPCCSGCGQDDCSQCAGNPTCESACFRCWGICDFSC